MTPPPTKAIEEARCAVHPDQRATSTCQRCGNYACARCDSGAGLESAALCIQCSDSAAASRYHVVPLARFILFNLLTSNVYSLYWFWKNWSAIKRRDQSDIWPIARTVFAGFSYFSLLSDINTQFAMRDSQRRLSSALGIGFLISNGLHRLPNPYSLLSFTGVLFLAPSALAIRDLASAAAIENAGWKMRHTFLLIAGVVCFGLVLAGAFLPDSGEL